MPELIPSRLLESRPRPLPRSMSRPERRLNNLQRKRWNLRLSLSWILKINSKPRRKRELVWNKNFRLSQMRRIKLMKNLKRSRKLRKMSKNYTNQRSTLNIRSRSNCNPSKPSTKRLMNSLTKKWKSKLRLKRNSIMRRKLRRQLCPS